jgi:UDP-N-acetyl-D-mannosaminuronic acid dehydrogenase
MILDELQTNDIVVIGTGYVGLPAALMLAKAGHRVIGVDIDENIVRAINDGVLLVKGEQLQEIMDEPTVRQNLKAQSIPCEADIFIIAVPTPLDKTDKTANLKMVVEATNSIVPHLNEGNLIILESTVPPLTCRNVITPLIERSGLRVGTNIHLAHCPERILPGDIFHEIIHNDRIIGAADSVSRDMAANVYSSFVEGELLLTDDITAEFVKLIENTYRDVNIALANELSSVAQSLQIDPKGAINLANRHPRVNILAPGIGVGGHCIPIDPWFIQQVDEQNSRLINTARQINDGMPGKIVSQIKTATQNINEPRIVAIGASYKANTADIRESPSIEIVRILRSEGYKVEHFDPLVDGMHFPTTMTDACTNADCLIILVEHKSILRELDQHEQDILNALNTSLILRF